MSDVLIVVVVILAFFFIYIGLQIVLATNFPLATVSSGSMKPALEYGDLIIIQGVPATSIQEGNIIAYDPPPPYNRGYTNLHRVVRIEQLENGTIRFKTKGDANPNEDPYWVSDNEVHGHILFRIPYFGHMALNPTISIALIIILFIIILLWTSNSLHKIKQKIHTIREKKPTFLTYNLSLFRRRSFFLKSLVQFETFYS